MKKITQEQINYIETMSKNLIKALKDFNKEDNEYYCYASENRAKFNRLRLELTKELINIKKRIYNESN